MAENTNRKWFKKADVIVIAVIVALSSAWLLFEKNGEARGNTAQITVNSDVVLEIQLDKAQNGTFRLEENDKVGFEIKDGQIAFFEVDCPDKVCERSGFLSRANETAVCLPNRVTLRIVGSSADENEVDGIVN